MQTKEAYPWSQCLCILRLGWMLFGGKSPRLSITYIRGFFLFHSSQAVREGTMKFWKNQRILSLKIFQMLTISRNHAEYVLYTSLTCLRVFSVLTRKPMSSGSQRYTTSPLQPVPVCFCSPEKSTMWTLKCGQILRSILGSHVRMQSNKPINLQRAPRKDR